MSKDPLDDVVDREEFEHFEQRNPAFRGALTRLVNRLREAFVRNASPVPGKPEAQQRVVFFLSHQAADDFFEIVLLAAHGFGFGALKLLRSLYERIVTILYLMAHPEEVSNFDLYADLHAYRVMNHAKEAGLDVRRLMPAEQIAAVEAAYREAKDHFGSQQSWTPRNLKMLAEEVGLGPLYSFCAFAPTLELHSTRVAMEGRLKQLGSDLVFTHGSQPAESDRALGCAHDLIVHLLAQTSEYFGWGIDTSDVAADVLRCWGGSRVRNK